jgi:protein involved in polysaccharide export with SLBB domain
MAFVCATGLLGCSSSSGTRFTLFPESNGLMQTTLAARQDTGPLDLPRELAKQPLPPFRVEPGDALLVLPTEQEGTGIDKEGAADKNPPPPIRIPSDQPILPDGSINLGRYGRLIVVGRTVEEIEAAIRSHIQAQIGRDPGFISVRIATRDSLVYYVLGDVNNPGVFPLKGRETVLDGILAAGGLNDRASRNNIIVSRPTAPDACRVVLPVCFREIVQLGDTTTNYQIMPGDRIIVPTRSIHERKTSLCLSCPRPPQACSLPRMPEASVPAHEAIAAPHTATAPSGW